MLSPETEFCKFLEDFGILGDFLWLASPPDPYPWAYDWFWPSVCKSLVFETYELGSSAIDV